MDTNGRRSLPVLALVAVATVLVVRRVRRARDEHRVARVREQRGLTLGDVVPTRSDDRETLLDTTIEDSFPASDPPAYWGRATAG
jgi:hypothetical protein